MHLSEREKFELLQDWYDSPKLQRHSPNVQIQWVRKILFTFYTNLVILISIAIAICILKRRQITYWLFNESLTNVFVCNISFWSIYRLWSFSLVILLTSKMKHSHLILLKKYLVWSRTQWISSLKCTTHLIKMFQKERKGSFVSNGNIFCIFLELIQEIELYWGKLLTTYWKSTDSFSSKTK